MSARGFGGDTGVRRVGSEPSASVPARLRMLEPLACLALAGHGLAVQVVATERAVPAMAGASLVLVVLGVAGLLGWRAPWTVAVRLGVIITLGFVPVSYTHLTLPTKRIV